ncbi:hypothetical protein [Microbacterium sp. A82]
MTLAMLTGCAAFGQTPSPTTTYTDASGNTTVVEWADYPAHAGQDGDALISYPDQAELPPLATDLINEVADAVSDASGIDLVPTTPETTWFSDSNWHEQVGNGYGGESLLITVNCCEFTSDTAPDRTKWSAILAEASRAAEASGFGTFIIDDQMERCGENADDCWILSATATDGPQWVSLSIQDAALDPTGDAEQDAEKFGWPTATISLGYGASVVQAGKQEEFELAMHDFIGLDRPDTTTSD